MPPQKPTLDLNDMPTRIAAGIVLGLLFLGGWWLIARNSMNDTAAEKGSEATTVAETTTEREDGTASSPVVESVLGPISEDTPIIAGSDEALEVADQAPGMSVKVASANLVQTGWIAVRDSNGRTLGAGRFEAGAHQGVEVPLLRGTEAGQSYQVLIYVDDGDRVFDLHKDILVTRSDGSVAGDVFSAL